MKKIIFFIILLFVISCQKKAFIRPIAYYRETFPQHKYQTYKSDTCPFVFEYSIYSKLTDRYLREKKPCWFNIFYPKYKAYLHFTTYKINHNLDSLLDDSYTLVYKHSTKADNIERQNVIDTSNNKFVTIFKITGNAASPFQFHITDTSNYFVRVSLYFETIPNYDSLYPYIQYIIADLEHLIMSFKWTKTKCGECFTKN